MNFPYRLLLALTLCGTSLGCSPDGLESKLIGAWYGGGPDGDQCFIFCGDGRLFTGDRPCTESDAGDFQQSLTVTFSESSFTLQSDDERFEFSVSVDGDRMSYSLEGTTYQTSRVADPGYCDDSARRP